MIDEQMGDNALQRVAEREAQDVTATWNAIRADLRKAGPFAKMILSFRESATDALVDLVYADPKDFAAITRMQGEVKRYIETMRMIHGYREGSVAVDANEDLADEDLEFLHTIEDPE